MVPGRAAPIVHIRCAVHCCLGAVRLSCSLSLSHPSIWGSTRSVTGAGFGLLRTYRRFVPSAGSDSIRSTVPRDTPNSLAVDLLECPCTST